MIKKYYLLAIVLGLTLSWISLNILGTLNFDNVFMDMTDTKKYSLTTASQKQAKELPLPLYITVYYSSEIAKENPVYGRYAEFVMQFLRQYQKQNPEKIFIAVKNPQPFSEHEKEAQQAGLTSFLSSDGRTNLYFGAVFEDSEGQKQVIASFSPARDFWLEKDITTLLAKFNHERQCTVGVISPIHKIITRKFAEQKQDYAITDELLSRCNLVSLPANVSEIPLNIDVLWLITPQKISESLSYALDQYVLRGGQLIILADKWIENPQYKTMTETTNKMNVLLNNWGLNISDSILGSQPYGKQIYISTSNGEKKAQYPLWLDLPVSTFNTQHEIMSKLRNITMRSPLEITESTHGKDIEVTPLIKVKEGMLYPYNAQLFDKNEVINAWQEDGKTHILAALSEGKYASVFKRPPATAQNNKLPYLYYSSKTGRILLIGDSDLIRDNVWLDDEELSDNGQVLLRAVEIFSNHSDMAELHKSQTKITQDSLGQKLYHQIYERHSNEITRLQYELQSINDEYNNLRQAIQDNKITMDAFLSQRLTKLQDKAKQKQERLKFLDYEMKRALSSRMQSIIFVNMIAIPIGLIGILIIGYILSAHYRQRKIKERYSAHK